MAFQDTTLAYALEHLRTELDNSNETVEDLYNWCKDIQCNEELRCNEMFIICCGLANNLIANRVDIKLIDNIKKTEYEKVSSLREALKHQIKVNNELMDENKILKSKLEKVTSDNTSKVIDELKEIIEENVGVIAAKQFMKSKASNGNVNNPMFREDIETEELVKYFEKCGNYSECGRQFGMTANGAKYRITEYYKKHK